MQTQSRMIAAVFALVGATVFWAGNYMLGPFAVEQTNPATLTFLRWTIALVPLFAIAHVVERPDWRAAFRTWPWMLILSATGVVGYNLALYFSLQYTSPLSASVINAFLPALIAIGAAIVLRERITPLGIVGIAFALIGVLIVMSGGDLNRLIGLEFGFGEILMIVAVLAFAVYAILGRLGPQLGPFTAVAIQSLFGVGLSGAAVAFTGGPALPSTSAGWWTVVAIAVFPSVGSYILWNFALSVLSPGRGGVFLNLITVFTALFTVLAGQPFTAAQLIGGAAVLAGVAAVTAHAFKPTGTVVADDDAAYKAERAAGS